MGNMKEYPYLLQAKCNLKKCEIINENCSIRSGKCGMINQNNLIIYHQNIRVIINKIEELLFSFTTGLPHLVCLLEHHLKDH